MKQGLVITLCAIGVLGIAAGVALPLTLCKNTTITFTNIEQCDKYLKEHAVATPEDAPGFGNVEDGYEKQYN
jgi:hypothetical protein